MEKQREKKRGLTLKKRLFTVVFIICLVQTMFLASGYLFVLHNLTERAHQNAAAAFDDTVGVVEELEETASNIQSAITINVRLAYLKRNYYFSSNEMTQLRATEAFNKSYDIMKLGQVSPAISELLLYLPTENAIISGIKGPMFNDQNYLGLGYSLYEKYSGAGAGAFITNKDAAGEVRNFYVKTFTGLDGDHLALLILKLSDDYFVNLMNYSHEGSTVAFVQDSEVIFCTKPDLDADSDLVYWVEEMRGKSTPAGMVEIGGEKYYLQLTASKGSAMKGVYMVPARQHYQEIIQFLAISGVSLLLMIGVWVYFSRNLIYKTVYGPVMQLVENLEKVKNNEYDIIQQRFAEQEWDEVTQIFNILVTKVEQNAKETYQKDLLMKNMELKFLQSQINPHFLYNTLDSIAYKANSGEIVDVNKITGYLSKMYRLVFNRGNDLLKISDVMLCGEMFLRICEFKYSNFRFKIKYDDDIADIEVVNLIVQTVVENAVVHGFTTYKKEFVVYIRAARRGEKIVFEVIDNGKGMNSERLEVFSAVLNDPNAKSESGLVNAQKRIRLYYGEDYGITIASRQGSYTKVTITMSANKPVTQADAGDDEDEFEQD